LGLFGSTPTRWTGSSRAARPRKRAVGKRVLCRVRKGSGYG
jgi:hypothetical protein